MNRRKVALACIIADVFENGKMTQTGIRAYVENRVSWASAQEAARTGLALRARESEAGEGFCIKHGKWRGNPSSECLRECSRPFRIF